VDNNFGIGGGFILLLFVSLFFAGSKGWFSEAG